MENLDNLKKFWNKKKVFITGHTGFKGAWLCIILKYLNSKIYGYALKPEKNSLFIKSQIGKNIYSNTYSDIRDITKLKKKIKQSKAEIIFHLAAQPLVLESYKKPLKTFSTNIMGTLNLLECIRGIKSIKSVVIITTDKVYKINKKNINYKEVDQLGGFDPYMNEYVLSSNDISVPFKSVCDLCGGSRNFVIPVGETVTYCVNVTEEVGTVDIDYVIPTGGNDNIVSQTSEIVVAETGSISPTGAQIVTQDATANNTYTITALYNGTTTTVVASVNGTLIVPKNSVYADNMTIQVSSNSITADTVEITVKCPEPDIITITPELISKKVSLLSASPSRRASSSFPAAVAISDFNAFSASSTTSLSPSSSPKLIISILSDKSCLILS